MRKINLFINKKVLVISLFVILLLGGSFLVYYFNYYQKEDVVFTDDVSTIIDGSDNVDDSLLESGASENDTILDEQVLVMVDIKGYVVHPGVYMVESDKRVIDVVKMAGGLLKDANTKVNNLSQRVVDEMVIVIYSDDEVKDFTKVKEKEEIENQKCVDSSIVGNDSCIKNDIVNDSNSSNSTNKVSINTASYEELTNVPYIGESKAKAIVSYREEHGLFHSIEDILNVSGIGESLFEKIKDYIIV